MRPRLAPPVSFSSCIRWCLPLHINTLCLLCCNTKVGHRSRHSSYLCGFNSSCCILRDRSHTWENCQVARGRKGKKKLLARSWPLRLCRNLIRESCLLCHEETFDRSALVENWTGSGKKSWQSRRCQGKGREKLLVICITRTYVQQRSRPAAKRGLKCSTVYTVNWIQQEFAVGIKCCNDIADN